MINRLKIAVVNEDFAELESLASELEEKIKSGWLASLSLEELKELNALNTEAQATLQKLKRKDLEVYKRLKKSLKYIE